MFPPIFEVCAAAPSVVNLLGVSPVRLWPFGEAPSGAVLPYAVWQQIGGSPENYINQVPDIDGFALQVDVYASTAAGARAVAEALRDAVEPVAHITRWGGDGREADTKYYRYSFDINWLVSR
jgi:hypothetical protein